MPIGVVRGVTRYKTCVPWEWDFVVSARAFLLQEIFMVSRYLVLKTVEGASTFLYIFISFILDSKRFLSPGHQTSFGIATVLILNLGINGDSISA